ncbi:hypothetical protein ACEPAG_938 [Sanghuangporus baumii]
MWSLFATLLVNSVLAAAWSTFVVPHTDGADDTHGLVAAVANYTRNSTILFEKGITYNIFSPITFPKFTNVEVSIQGNLTYPTNISSIQAAVTSSTYSGSWIAFSGGSNVTLRGSTDPQWGWIDGHGQAWWDAMNQENRPHGIAFSKIAGGVIRDMKLWKPIAWNFATSGSNDIHAFNNKILAISDTDAFPFNTDGFSAGGTNLLFESNYIVNGDDCLTIGSEGGHGLSIGSLGKGGSVADVQNVLIENNFMKNALYGARFKSWTGGNGLARNITWRNIAFENVVFPVYVTQNYWDQNLGPAPNVSSTNNTHIVDFLFENFSGTINDRANYTEGSCISDPCWYAVPGATGKEVIIFDLYPNTTTNIVAKDIFARTESDAPVAVMCDPDTVTNDVGFVCHDGIFRPTKAGF